MEGISPNIDLILCSRPPFCCYARQKGMLVGARTDRYDQLSCCTPQFLDFNFHKPDFELHLRMVKKIQPKYAVAPDILDAKELDDVLEKAEELSKYATNVIIVPHLSGLVEKIPSKFVIGYSIPTSYGGAEIGMWELQGRKVHLLGGTPRQQFKAWQYIPGVVSIDGNSYIKMAQYGKYLGKDLTWQSDLKNTGKDMGDLIKLSIDNLVRVWKGDA